MSKDIYRQDTLEFYLKYTIIFKIKNLIIER